VIINQRLLIVDDDPLLRQGMAALFRGSVAHVEVAESVAEAMRQLSSLQPSHIILDLNLGDGHGTTVLRYVRENALPIRVAVVSGSSDSRLLDEMQLLEPDATFRKPPDWDALRQWLAT
jgi:DNA-binding NarL/FixJ family response regulator